MEHVEHQVAALNAKYAELPSIHFKCTRHGLIRLSIKSPLCEAQLYLQGAQVTAFKPSQQRETIWLSSQANFQQGKPIRGGIPICWPWFGKHSSNANLPQHGFARLSEFSVKDIHQNANNEIQVLLELIAPQEYQQTYAARLHLQVKLIFGLSLTIELQTKNISNKTQIVNQALHGYYRVENISELKLFGLTGESYFDQLNQTQLIDSCESVSVTGEIDRIYQTGKEHLILQQHDQLILQQVNADSVVVWNPWKTKAKNMPDFPDDDYRQMLCVEAANTQNRLSIMPQQTHLLSQTISLQ